MPSALRIRPVASADFDRVMEIEIQSFTLPWTREAYEQLSAQPAVRMRVAERDGTVVGYMLFQVVGGDLELHTFAVDPLLRGQGVGAQLLQQLLLEAGAMSAARVYLQVRASNAPAIALYQRFGFVQVGMRRGYYHDNNEDALVMCRRLR